MMSPRPFINRVPLTMPISATSRCNLHILDIPQVAITVVYRHQGWSCMPIDPTFLNGAKRLRGMKMALLISMERSVYVV
jgi:hypothetical protein